MRNRDERRRYGVDLQRNGKHELKSGGLFVRAEDGREEVRDRASVCGV